MAFVSAAVCPCVSAAVADSGSGSSACRVLDNTYRNAVYNWLSPEVLGGQTPTERSDLYSFCVVIWELLHGQPLYLTPSTRRCVVAWLLNRLVVFVYFSCRLSVMNISFLCTFCSLVIYFMSSNKNKPSLPRLLSHHVVSPRWAPGWYKYKSRSAPSFEFHGNGGIEA